MAFEFSQFWIREAWANVRRNRLMSLLAVLTVTVGLFILGSFYLTVANFRAAVAQETAKLDLTVMLDHNISSARRSQVDALVGHLPRVASHRLVLRGEVLKEWQKEFSDFPLDDWRQNNPMSDELRIKLRDPADLFLVRQYLLKVKGVSASRDDTNADLAARKLLALDHFATVAGLVALLVLSASILLIIHNAIRLTVYARRREIRIMQLVGATPGFIRVPFLLEGCFYGLAGAVVAAVALAPVYLLAVRGNGIIHSLLPLAPGPLLGTCMGLMVVSGLVFGFAGSVISLHQPGPRASG